MITEMNTRRYAQRRRAQQQEETRERIVDAAVALHEELGPAATTISALAERAGVQRLTVYRHFASDEELFGACSSKWFSRHPPPDISTIASAAPSPYTRRVLTALYGYYRSTSGMWHSIYRDADQVPALQGPLGLFDDYLEQIEEQLLAAWAAGQTEQTRGTVHHALRFATWESLARQGLDDRAMAKLVNAWIQAWTMA